MARADTASASLRSDSIKGLAESIANPAYRRLLSAEPLLRRAVPVLIVAFMVTVCIGAAVQVLEHRRQAVFEAKQSVAALADHFATVFERRSRDGRSPWPRTSDALAESLPDWAAGGGRRVLVADADGNIVASLPNAPAIAGRSLLDVLGPLQPLTTFAADAGTREIALGNGQAAYAAVRARVACQWNAKPRINTTKPVVANNVMVKAVIECQFASASSCPWTTASSPIGFFSARTAA